jgi:hypothetical protein
MSPSQGRYQHKEQTHTHFHVSNGIRTHGPNVRAGEDSSFLRLCDHYDRPLRYLGQLQYETKVQMHIQGMLAVI